jgi:glutamine synthetase type III
VEVKIMTVSAQVKQALASLKSAQASLESFALSTQNQQAKQLFTQNAQQTQTIIDSLETRVQQLEQEEPQYKGF